MTPRVLAIYAGMVDVTALCVLFVVPRDGMGDRPGTLLMLLALAVVVGAKPVRIPALHIQIVAMDLFVLCALMVLAPLAAPLVALAAVASAVLGPNRRPLSVRTAFNLGVIPLSASAAALTYVRLVAAGTSVAERVLPLLAATAAYFLVNTVLAAAAIALHSRSNVLGVWWGYAPWNAVSTVASALMAVGLVILLSATGPVVLLVGLVAVLPILAQGQLKAMESA